MHDRAREAAVDVLDDVFRRRAVILQHVLDEIDPPSGAVEFVAKQRIGWTGRGAEAAMHARPEDLLGLLDIGIRQLGRCKVRLHDGY